MQARILPSRKEFFLALVFLFLASPSSPGAPPFPPWKEGFSPKPAAPGWKVEIPVPPPLLAAPFGISIDPTGLAVVEVREGRVLALNEKGKAFEVARGAGGNFFDHDGEGNLYTYCFPDGRVRKIRRAGGKVEEWSPLPEGHSGGAVAVTASGKRIAVLKLLDGGVGEIYLFRPGKKTPVEVDAPRERILAVGARGETLFAASQTHIYRIRGKSLQTFLAFRRKGWLCAATLAPGPRGGFFGAFAEPGGSEIRYIDIEGRTEPLYSRPPPGAINGIDFDPERARLWFVVKEEGLAGFLDLRRWAPGKRSKGIQAVIVVRCKGLVTPMPVHLSPSGKIYVNGDETGLYRLDRRFKPTRLLFPSLCSYQPPPADFAFLGTGKIVYTAAAPGFPGKILLLRERKRPKVLTGAIRLPGGISRRKDGRFVIADYGSDALYLMDPRGRVKLLAGGFRFPMGVAARKKKVYVTCSHTGRKGDPTSVLPLYPEILVEWSPRSGKRILFDTRKTPCGGSLLFLDVTPSGSVVFAAGRTVRSLDPGTGESRLLAAGFKRAAGVCAGRRGAILVTDYDAHALVVLRKNE